MWKQSRPPAVRKLTRKLAAEFATMPAPPQDRNLSEARLETYRWAVENGQMRSVSWATCYCRETGETYRINGKHTSTLFAEKVEVPDDFHVTIETYEADTLRDVAQLYATFDSKAQLRTASDINKAFAASSPDLESLPSRIIDLVVTGVSLAKWGTQYANVPASRRAEQMMDNVAFAVWVAGILGPHKTPDNRKLYRGPIVAAMLITWTKSQKAATDFWTAVRDETGERPDMPDRKLSRYLLETSVAYGKGAQAPPSRKADTREMLAKCLHAWNAWRRGERTLSLLKYHAGAKLPAAI